MSKHITSHSSNKLSSTQKAHLFEDTLDKLCDEHFSSQDYASGHRRCVNSLQGDKSLKETIIKIHEKGLLSSRYQSSWVAKVNGLENCEIYQGGLLRGVIGDGEFLRICRIKMGKREMLNVLIGSKYTNKFKSVRTGRDKVEFRTSIPTQAQLFDNDGTRYWPESIWSYAVSRSYQGASLDNNRATYNKVKLAQKKIKVGKNSVIELVGHNKLKVKELREYEYIAIKVEGEEAPRKFYLDEDVLFSAKYFNIDLNKDDYDNPTFVFDADKYRPNDGSAIKIVSQESISLLDLAWHFDYRVSNVINFPTPNNEENAIQFNIEYIASKKLIRNDKFEFEYVYQNKNKGFIQIIYKDGVPSWGHLEYYNGVKIVQKRVDIYPYDFSTIMFDYDRGGKANFFVKLDRSNPYKLEAAFVFEQEKMKFHNDYFLELDSERPEREPRIVLPESDQRRSLGKSIP